MTIPNDETESPLGMVSPGSVATQWLRLQERVAMASVKSGRNLGDITIVGITKYVDLATTKWLVDAGCRDLGESRPQSLWQKQSAFEAVALPCQLEPAQFELGQVEPRWHFIGHLQRNKSLKTIAKLSLLHSLDSIRLAQQIQQDAERLNITVRTLIEVNISGEPNKTGILSEELPSILDSLANLDRIQFCGLMGMAGLLTPNPRSDFVKLRELRDNTRQNFGDRFDLSELSMGMSGDFEAAIEEGSTMVRIGSLLFGPTGS